MRQAFGKRTFWFAAAAIGFAIWSLSWRASAETLLASQLSSPGMASTGLISHVLEGEGQATRVIIIDPQMRAMGVYEISREKGEIVLKSIRNLRGDLQLLDFNSEGLSPEDIRKQLDRQQ